MSPDIPFSPLRFVLPYPPSIWDMYVGWGKTRRHSPEYDKWRRDAGYFIKAPKQPISKPFVISIGLKRPNRRQDVDNRGKPILDALQHYGVIKNDNLCESMTVRWTTGPDECVVLLQEKVEDLAA